MRDKNHKLKPQDVHKLKSTEDVIILAKSFRESGDWESWLYVTLAANTGLKFSELSKLRWVDILNGDETAKDEATICIKEKDRKYYERHFVISDNTKKAIKEYLYKAEVFPEHYESDMTGYWVFKSIRQDQENFKSNIRGICYHTIVCLFIVWLCTNSKDVTSVGDWIFTAFAAYITCAIPIAGLSVHKHRKLHPQSRGADEWQIEYRRRRNANARIRYGQLRGEAEQRELARQKDFDDKYMWKYEHPFIYRE